MSTLSRVIFDPDTTPPSAPSGVTATALSQSTIRVSWSPSTDTGGSGLAGYRVYRATTSGGVYGPIGTDLSTASLSFDDTTLTASTTRFYRIEAFDANANRSSLSAIASATTLPAPAAGLQWPTHTTGYVSLIPGVGGYGMNTVAGSGRHLATPATTVILVNSLATGNTGGAVSGYGPNVFAGTWEYAWRHTASPKVIIPIISGWVTIQDSVNCQGGARSGYVSYYGQFAPGQGLYLRGTNVETGGASNVAVWHLRSYMGDDVAGLPAGNRDCFSSGYGQGVTSQIALINCEFAWSIDEVAGFFRSHNQLTFVGCAFFEPLHASVIIHPEDGPGFDHGFGPQIGGDTGQPQTASVSTFRNLWAHTTGRNPLISAVSFTHANNLHYNHGRPSGGSGNAVQIVATGATQANYANIIGNAFVRGPNNNASLVAVSVASSMPSGSAGYLSGNAQFGWSAVSSQNGFLTGSPSGYAASTVQSAAFPSSWGSGLTGVLNWAANPLSPTQAEWSNYVALMEQTVGAQPIRRTTGRLKLVFDQIRDRLTGVTQTDQFVDTVTEAGGWFTVPSTTVDPLNPGSEWHAPLPTGSDRDTPYTSGTFSDGKSRVGYTRLEEWAYEQHLYVTTEQAPVTTGDYDFIDNPVGYTDHWVSPTRTTNGSGNSQADPMQWSQMMSFNPNGGRHRFIVMPGQLSVTGNIPNDTKMPFLDPQFSGTAANPVLVKAQFPATRSTTTRGQMTIIRRTANVGSILGTSGRDYWRFDGFKFEGGNGSQGGDGGNEKANIVVRGASGWWLSRIWIDGEEADHSSLDSTNGGGMYIQGVDNMVIRDVIVENIGDHSSADQYWQGIELYDMRDSDISYFTIDNCYGMGLFMKGQGVYNIPFQRNHIHHGIVSQAAEAAYMAMRVNAGTDPANHNHWYNLVADQRGVSGFHKCFLLNAIEPHTGTHVQNCTFIGGRESFSAVSGPTYTEHVSFHNNVFYLSGSHIVFQDGSYTANSDDIVFDWNQYNGHTVSFAETTSTLSNLGQWQGTPYFKDANGSSAAPSFVNFAGGDFRTNGAAVAPDHWNRFGGGTVPRGAYQPYGCRRDL